MDAVEELNRVQALQASMSFFLSLYLFLYFVFVRYFAPLFIICCAEIYYSPITESLPLEVRYSGPVRGKGVFSKRNFAYLFKSSLAIQYKILCMCR